MFHLLFLNCFCSCVLLTTDVAARGLDLPNVQHVIHYHVGFHLFFDSMILGFQQLCLVEVIVSPVSTILQYQTGSQDIWDVRPSEWENGKSHQRGSQLAAHRPRGHAELQKDYQNSLQGWGASNVSHWDQMHGSNKGSSQNKLTPCFLNF